MADDSTAHPVGVSSEHPPPIIARTIKPRNYKGEPMPVVAVGRDCFLAESGETGTLTELIDRLPECPPTLFCNVGAAELVTVLTSHYCIRYGDTWQFRATCHDRVISTPNELMKVTKHTKYGEATTQPNLPRAVRQTTAIHFFGWKSGKATRYHKIIDPIVMYGHRLETVWPDDTPTDNPEWRRVTNLLRWGVTLRDFCHANGIQVRPTMGSMAAQFLTDPRFYPNARRKVPHQINERARENLPGNHYTLNVQPSPSNNFTAHYLDQHSAHHYHARRVPLPDSNSCYAYGRFLDLDSSAFRDSDARFMGLYCLDLSAPTNRPPFDWIGKDLDAVFVYTNELAHVLDMGYSVRGVRAAWGSVRRDAGMPKFAEWAGAELDRRNNPAWLKPLLLATYGVLAMRPVNGESIFRLAKKGNPVSIQAGNRVLSGLRVQNPRKLEPRIAHVLQRGMIEAATRSESIGLAQYLEHLGHRVLSIYADAVMVEADDDKPLPTIPDPWRIKRTLNHLQFVNRQSFTSDGMTKLPGVSQEMRRYQQHSNRATRMKRTDN